MRGKRWPLCRFSTLFAAVNPAATTEAPAASGAGLKSLPFAWGYAMLVLSVIFNGARYNFESASLKASAAGAAPITPFAVVVAGSFAGALSFFVVAWICRLCGWTAGSLHLVTVRQCVRETRSLGWIICFGSIGASVGGWFVVESNKLSGPEFTAFVGNLMPVLLVASGICFGERLRKREFAAIFVAIAGAFLFSYRGGHLNWIGLGVMSIGCIIMVIKKSIMKHATGAGHLPSVMAVSLVVTGLLALVMAIFTGTLQFGSRAGVVYASMGGVSGAAIGMALLYAGLNVVGLARGAPIDCLRPLAVLMIGLLRGTPLPAWTQMVGGAMVLIGSVTLASFCGRRPPRGDAAASPRLVRV